MVNRHHFCHGGYLFTLADSAFAYACNRYKRNPIASACHNGFLGPAPERKLREAANNEAGSSTSSADLVADAVAGNPQ